ncbi:MAG: ABC transporter permease [Bacteroidales bacterium]|nr:ABC transporter permease [Bacteroidales bacterium]
MFKIIKISWRNLWRNKRRTLITVSSIFFALFYAILMRSFQLGTYNLMIDKSVTQFTGHLQIQDRDFEDNPTIDYAIPYTENIKNILDENKHVDYYFPRVQAGALASSGPDSKISMVMGVDYDTEIKLVGLDKSIVRFYLDSVTVIDIASGMDSENASVFSKYKEKRYSNKEDLREDLFADGLDTVKYIQQIYDRTIQPVFNFTKYGNDVLIGYKLAQYLDLSLGDSLILIGQGFRGTNAVGKFKISGLLKFPLDDMNRMFVYMPLHTAQMFLSAFEVDNIKDTTFYVNYVAINTFYQASMTTGEYDKMIKVKTEIEEKLDNDMLTVVGWRNLNKGLMDTVQMGNAKGAIFIFILYLVISFGVLGTVMMLVEERKREFGVMMALGMKRRLLAVIVSFEMIFMGVLASIAGIVVTTPILWIGNKNPIKIRGGVAEQFSKMNMDPVLKFQAIGSFVFDQIAVVFIIVLVVLVYAVFKIRKLKVISSLKA